MARLTKKYIENKEKTLCMKDAWREELVITGLWEQYQEQQMKIKERRIKKIKEKKILFKILNYFK
jgi:hypothetical protein